MKVTRAKGLKWAEELRGLAKTSTSTEEKEELLSKARLIEDLAKASSPGPQSWFARFMPKK